jgi:hypothetical protein
MIAEKGIIPAEVIEKKIYFIRNQKVMLSSDLAGLYQVEPRVLIQPSVPMMMRHRPL